MLSVNGMEVHYLSIAGHRLKHFVFFGWSARHPIHLANLNITSHPRHVFFVSVFLQVWPTASVRTLGCRTILASPIRYQMESWILWLVRNCWIASRNDRVGGCEGGGRTVSGRRSD